MTKGKVVFCLICGMYGAMIFALFAGLIVGQLSGTIKPVQLPEDKANKR